MEDRKYSAKEIISGFRKASGYDKAEDVAKLIGVAKATYLKYEKEPQKMTLEVIEKLEQLYGEEFTDFFFKHKLYRKQE